MAVTDLTTTASIRAALGVSEKEIRDAVLLNPIYSVPLIEAIYALHEDLFTNFVTVAGLETRTQIQQRFFDLVQLYSAYFIAKLCLASVSMFAPQKIKDAAGSELMRMDDPYAQLRKDLPAMLSIFKVQLLTVYNQINPISPLPSAVERIRVVAAPLGVDPVTG